MPPPQRPGLIRISKINQNPLHEDNSNDPEGDHCYCPHGRRFSPYEDDSNDIIAIILVATLRAPKSHIPLHEDDSNDLIAIILVATACALTRTIEIIKN